MPLPSAAKPLTGRCACGGVRFQVSAPFETARYCHCHRCQRRTGTSCSANARVGAEAFTILQGEELLHAWQPPEGQAKWYCADCGGQLFSRPEGAGVVYVRMGALEADPEVRPAYRQWISSAAPWEPIPEDGLPRYDGAGP
ncbi:MAG TPA: GFA family protein [Solirubrobacteraceae bacterium]|jgi:hypothetical protein|nr:GFA family protein [Solirubrobacteraceae bacterium]